MKIKGASSLSLLAIESVLLTPPADWAVIRTVIVVAAPGATVVLPPETVKSADDELTAPRLRTTPPKFVIVMSRLTGAS